MTINAINSNKPIEVAKGGTGVASPTDHSVLVGSGTGAITPITVGATGEILTGTGADPAFSATPDLTSISFDGGTNNLDFYDEVVSGNLGLTFGGGSVGITASVNFAAYSRIGDIIAMQVIVFLTSKGSSTGDVVIPAGSITMPSPTYVTPLTVFPIVITFTGQVTALMQTNGDIWLYNSATASASTRLTNAEFANNSAYLITGTYSL